MRSDVNELKWWLVCFLLRALQAPIVMVYSDEPRKMLAVLPPGALKTTSTTRPIDLPHSTRTFC